MDDFARLFSEGADSWNARQILANCGTSFLLGLFISRLYRWTHRQLTVSFSFVNTLVIVSMIMGMVIMVIGNNVARAFGLAGAMSIIRFRTAVKDTRDTAFVFYALGAGMAAGTGNLHLAILGTLLIGLFIALLHLIRHGVSPRCGYVLAFDLLPAEPGAVAGIHLPLFKRYFSSWELSSVRSARAGKVTRYAYNVILRKPDTSDAAVADLAGLEGLRRVTLSTNDIEGDSQP